ncbi:LacI family DNA-binding transcriptional regulator [Aneurinibacillus migulanus]|uniref:Transcriptional regulator n=1 Tax=Aneurinibacillus migulanus TaxID=47500 RepID=A0A0D1Y336_ANEMI|nr:LacI family DNA-binding transcriptional regulator [Aneurinibacillus migulanus]KIV53667.1 transcriptional regulator [Aneurinibacillus migulanus]KON97676.1 transcriptional regulator [Aneurinibacillus migulanus]MED0894432.1 LacI family DNA-binding transcriptional regulator [Aneurinibacillus migulanus]MED1617042.1 LacI family DNA-binding transcriptional regulator [Aneurinibacillus migulanus]SDJ35467.1 transcriptional regulator, LacI family [Aneurinibacillus migulanus]
MKPTIYDVAREASVSIATVSKVINNTGRISDKTRKKVLEVMEQLHYQPSVVASALTGKRTYTIGLLIPDLANPFFAEIARYVEDRGNEMGFSLVMCSTDNNSKKEEKYISLLRQKSVDGIILASGFTNDKILKELNKEKFPLALISQDISGLSVDSVTVDDFLAGYQATEHLLTLNHKKIAVIAENSRSSKERIRGYREALQDAKLDYDDNLIVISDSMSDTGKQLADQLLELSDRPTAIICCNNLLAIGAIHSAREKGLILPDELSITGFDDTILATAVEPPLTTVKQPIREMSYQVMDLLIQKIEGKTSTKQKRVLVPKLIIRKSTKALKQ